MKWRRYTIKTTTEAVDIISSELDDLGMKYNIFCVQYRRNTGVFQGIATTHRAN